MNNTTNCKSNGIRREGSQGHRQDLTFDEKMKVQNNNEAALRADEGPVEDFAMSGMFSTIAQL